MNKLFPKNMSLMLKMKLTPLLTLESPLGEIPVEMTGYKQLDENKYAVEFSIPGSEIGQMIITAPVEEFQKLSALIQECFKEAKKR